jgi:bifunctional non-homologous end joining protein LigD
MNPEKVALYYKDDRSDKVYQLQLEPSGDGWVINYQNGKRGKTLTSKSRTPVPISYEVAKKAYDKIVRTKLAGGYTQNGTGEAFVDTENAGRVTTYLPQLLNDTTIEEIIARFEAGEDIWMQCKHDGERRGVLGTDQKAIGANRRGLAVALKEQIHAASVALTRQCGGFLELDTEDMGDHLMIFDILFLEDDLKPLPYSQRIRPLVAVKHKIHQHQLTKSLKVDLPVRVNSIGHILTFVASAKSRREEGVVFRFDVPCTPGRPHSGGNVLKLKFWKSATCRVRSIHETKNSIGLELLSEDGWIFVGNCTADHAKKGIVEGDLVEIKYLYAYLGGSLFEPSFKDIRTDLLPVAANTNQLIYKK